MNRIIRPRAAVAIACLFLAATSATAEDEFYIGLGAGLFSTEVSGARGRPSESYPSPLDSTITHDRGNAFSGVVGYRLAQGLRLEGELSYRESDFDQFTVREPGSLAALLPPGLRQDPTALDGLKGTYPMDGELSAISLMVNLHYDFDLGHGWKPYVGGGIGLSRISMKAASVGRQTTDDDDTVFGYQVGAGLGYEFGGSDDRPVIVTLDFRHFATADPTFRGSVTGTPFDREFRGNYVGVGLRFGL